MAGKIQKQYDALKNVLIAEKGNILLGKRFLRLVSLYPYAFWQVSLHRSQDILNCQASLVILVLQIQGISIRTLVNRKVWVCFMEIKYLNHGQESAERIL